MAALDFPALPTNGQKFPVTPVVGVPQYTWDGEKWTTIGGALASGGQPGVLQPLMDNPASSAGVAVNYSREDHVHPTDTSRAPATAVIPATNLEYVSNSQPDKMLTPRAIWGSVVPVVLVDAASVAPDLSKGSDFTWQPGTSRTLANPINGKPGQKGVMYFFPGLGSVATFGAAYKFPNGTKPVHAGIMIISYVVGADGTTMYCNAGVSYS